MDTKEVPNTEAETSEPTATEQFRTQSHAVRDDIRELGRATKDLAHEKLDDARRAAGEVYDQGRRKAGDFEDQIVEYVREKPMKSLLIAAGAGVLLGMIWTRR